MDLGVKSVFLSFRKRDPTKEDIAKMDNHLEQQRQSRTKSSLGVQTKKCHIVSLISLVWPNWVTQEKSLFWGFRNYKIMSWHQICWSAKCNFPQFTFNHPKQKLLPPTLSHFDKKTNYFFWHSDKSTDLFICERIISLCFE